MTRLLFLGDLGPSGFGSVTTDLGRALIAQGADVRFWSTNKPADELPEPFASRVVRSDSEYGWMDPGEMRRKLGGVMAGSLFDDGWVPEAAFMLGDMGSIIESRIAEVLPVSLPTYHYAAVEGTVLPPSWAPFWARFRPIAMSEFVADELAKILPTRPPVMLHGIDLETFYPVSAARPIRWQGKDASIAIRSKSEAKRAFGFHPKQLVILRTDANVVRKAYFELFAALAPVLARHPEAVFAAHCRVRDFGGDLDDMRSHFAEPVRRRMGPLGLWEKFPMGIPREVLATLYNAADIYVSNSGEGFGLTIAEAMACGVPVVAQDFSAVPEVVGGAGILVPVGRLFPNIYSHFWAVADVDALGAAVDGLLQSAGRRRSLGALGALRAQGFRWSDKAAELLSIIGATEKELVAA